MRMRRNRLYTGLLIAPVIALSTLVAWAPAAAQGEPQTRPAGSRVEVPVNRIVVDDGDTVVINWPDGDAETVRILGIDTPEIRHETHNLPYDQSFGREASGFAKGAFATATKVELLRAAMMDPYGRTLGYLFVNDHNYSVLIIRARLANETVSHYGDNGFPAEAEACLKAAEKAGPTPFEPPYQFRRRMREVSEWMREEGLLPPLDE
jgi:endonuclease YncB( thermonuclease family)